MGTCVYNRYSTLIVQHMTLLCNILLIKIFTIWTKYKQWFISISMSLIINKLLPRYTKTSCTFICAMEWQNSINQCDFFGIQRLWIPCNAFDYRVDKKKDDKSLNLILVANNDTNVKQYWTQIQKDKLTQTNSRMHTSRDTQITMRKSTTQYIDRQKEKKHKKKNHNTYIEEKT